VKLNRQSWLVHTEKAYRESRSKALFILYFIARGRSVVNIMPQPGKERRHPLNRRLGGPQTFWRREKYLASVRI
jgi:hypothetical protein